MFEFLDTLATHLETKLTLPSMVKVGGTLEGVERSAITIRPIVGRPGERYIEGRSEGVAFQILVKQPSQENAIKTIVDIARACEDLDRTVYENLISCSIYVTPNFVEETSTKEYIYTALFQAELEGVNV